MPLVMEEEGERRLEAAKNDRERVVAGVYAEALGLAQVGVTEDVFSLGAHSLLLMRVQSRLRTAVGVDVPVMELFRRPTVRRLSEYLESQVEGGMAQTPKLEALGRSSAPLSHGQERLWFLNQMPGGDSAYNMPAVLELEGTLDEAALVWSLEEITKRHEVLRSVVRVRDGVAEQVVQEWRPFELQREDLSGWSEEGRQKELLEKRVEEEARRPFALETEVPIRGSFYSCKGGNMRCS